MAKPGLVQMPLPRHRAFYLTFALGAAALVTSLLFVPAFALQIGAVVFFAAYGGLILLQLPHLSETYLRAHADEEDAPAALLFVITIALIAVAAVALFTLLNSQQQTQPLQLVLGIGSVLLGWLAIHIMWGLHYAYEYYEASDASETKGAGKKRPIIGGLEFPGGEQPDGWAFLYFAFVLGMTAQTSDVAVASNKMRRIVLVHGIFSFLFNTVIVAAAVNIVVSLG